MGSCAHLPVSMVLVGFYDGKDIWCVISMSPTKDSQFNRFSINLIIVTSTPHR
uniref:Uncharacterized protein n=1 Tax=Anguilla anguilla TaxID=7936 RepID=A0A0E9PBB0_ANGAN